MVRTHTSYLEMLDAETRLLNAQLALVNARLSELTGLVELYRFARRRLAGLTFKLQECT